MLYLGNASSEGIRRAMRARLLGQMCSPGEGRHPVAVGPDDWVDYAADNGCFRGRYPGGQAWLRWLAALVQGRHRRCLFAVAPDRLDPDLGHDMGAASLEMSLPYLDQVRGLSVPVALVAQNGLRPEDVPWADLDWIFLGGVRTCPACGWWPTPAELRGVRCPRCAARTVEWKVSPAAARLAAAAALRGTPVHMGRVNSALRWRQAELLGCASVDGTYLTFGPTRNLGRLLGWSDDNLWSKNPFGVTDE